MNLDAYTFCSECVFYRPARNLKYSWECWCPDSPPSTFLSRDDFKDPKIINDGGNCPYFVGK